VAVVALALVATGHAIALIPGVLTRALRADVTTGDVIRFEVAQGGSDSTDSTTWNPTNDYGSGPPVGPVITNNFDVRTARVGLEECFVRRYDQKIPDDVKSEVKDALNDANLAECRDGAQGVAVHGRELFRRAAAIGRSGVHVKIDQGFSSFQLGGSFGVSENLS
jgi:hypothetical protein